MRIGCELCKRKKHVENCLTYKSQKVIYAPRSDEKLLTSCSKHSKEALCGEVAERLKALPC
jgi:hypothetical protein